MVILKEIDIDKEFFKLSTGEAFNLYSACLFLLKLFEKYGFKERKRIYCLGDKLFGVRVEKYSGSRIRCFVGYYFPKKFFFIRGKKDVDLYDIEVKDIDENLEKNKDIM